jgi:hypothetical protein
VDEFLKNYSDILEFDRIKGVTKTFDLGDLVSQEAPIFDNVISLRPSVRNFGIDEVALADVHKSIVLAQLSSSTYDR